ncbi:MAG TPA: hypothetical protein VLI92_04000 [Candidatus Saccharimonadales bacterium]|nr:hypothetical protein [Candidatus Saccharimonadales bacterium]
MNRKLTAKVQQIKPNIAASVKSFADILIIEPDNQTVQLKKGIVYTVFDVTASIEMNTQVVSKVIHDTIHDSYFQSDNISPIQSLEKAISAVRDRINKMSGTELNIITGVLWGNVMYVVQYGKNGSFLIRGEEAKHINSNAEGNFSAASGMVKDEDVIVFCTHAFAEQYSPEKLLTTSIQAETLSPNTVGLILKFVVDTSFSETESIDFGIKPKSKPKMQFPQLNLFKRKPKTAAPTDTAVTPVTSINLKNPSKLKITPMLIIIVAAVLLVASIIFGIYKKNNAKSTKVAETVRTTPTPMPTEQAQSTATPTPEANTQTISSDVLYDIKISDPQANPSGMVVVGKQMAVADKTSGKIYSSAIATPKFIAESTTFPQIANLNNVDGTLNFTDASGYKTYGLTSKNLTSYPQTGLGVTSAYLDFIYTLSGDKIIKYTKEGTTLTPSTWAENADFTGAKSFSIAVSIFVLKADGTIVSYTRGVKDSFSIKGLAQPLSNPSQLITDINWDNLYIADNGNKRVVVLKKDGTFIKQIKYKDTNAWNDIRSISVTDDEKQLFVLNGSKVYQTGL